MVLSNLLGLNWPKQTRQLKYLICQFSKVRTRIADNVTKDKYRTKLIMRMIFSKPAIPQLVVIRIPQNISSEKYSRKRVI